MLKFILFHSCKLLMLSCLVFAGGCATNTNWQSTDRFLHDVTVIDAGVQLLAGSDTQNNCLVPGHSLHWELAQMVRVGLSPAEALRTATINAAVAMGRSQDLGQVKAGFRAYLVLLDANPLERIENTREIKGVVQNGRWYNQAALEQIRDQIARSAPAL